MYLVAVATFLCLSACSGGEFYIDWDNDRFVKDGATFQYASAGMHYFRIPYQYWENRILAAKSAGLNAIQTYVAWNMHEPEPGIYDFEGNLNIIQFIEQVQLYDMALILRVGPYICAEWNFGGLPPWLLAIPGMQVRTQNVDFLKAVHSWVNVFLPIIKPYLYANGGPIIMVQVENEYGSFGCDHQYINTLYTMFHDVLGDEAVYFTTDGPGGFHCGSVNTTQILTTIDFGVGGDAAADFAKLRKYQPHGPSVNSEFYTGWLDHWRNKHATRPADTLGVAFDKLMDLNASVNFYMWHGGTNFGLTSGAQRTSLKVNPTSYDYDAPQSESGDLKMDKYWAIRNVTEKHFPGNKLPVPIPWPKLGGITINPKIKGLLTDQISSQSFILCAVYPLKMEELKVFEGMIAYQHELTDQALDNVEVVVQGVHDRAYVLADGQYAQVVKRENSSSFIISANETVTILVENMGYIGFSKAMLDYSAEYKGILNVTIDGTVLTHWYHYKINVRDPTLNNTLQIPPDQAKEQGGWLNGKKLLSRGPAIFQDTIELEHHQLMDTFLNITESWSKGYLIVNDILIGRYWPDAGPQFTLYIPGVYLVEGTNTFTLIELQSVADSGGVTYLTDTPYIDGPVNPNA